VWQIVARFLAGVAVGIALPWVLLGAARVCSNVSFSGKVRTFLSILPAYTAAFSRGELVALISGRFEIWIAGGSVLTGLTMRAFAYRNSTEHEPQRTSRAYTLHYLTPFVLFAVFSAGLLAF